MRNRSIFPLNHPLLKFKDKKISALGPSWFPGFRTGSSGMPSPLPQPICQLPCCLGFVTAPVNNPEVVIIVAAPCIQSYAVIKVEVGRVCQLPALSANPRISEPDTLPRLLQRPAADPVTGSL